jgi:3-deoxy-D-manno-octulosonic-acid transferase
MKTFDIFYNIFFIKPIKLFLPIIEAILPKMSERESHIRQYSPLPKTKTNSKRLWFHASSMGEFEQAKPIIEMIKHKHPEIYIICSFYSPSGYNNQKTYKYADLICYIPFDTKKNADDFIDSIQPDLAVFVRYDMWLNHLNALEGKIIPTYLICATPPANKLYLSLFKGFLKYTYGKFTYIFTMTPEDISYFESLQIQSKIISSFDSRFDRIISTVNQYSTQPIINKDVLLDFIVLIVGSSWEPDEKIVSKAVDIYNNIHTKKIKVIYVPHEPTEKHIEKLYSLEPDLIRFSEIEKQESLSEQMKLINNKHIVVDSIGKLLQLYANADIVYVGGAFGAGVHSVTEPAGYGIPVICGKSYYNSPDAKNMVKKGILKPVSSINEMLLYLEYLSDNPEKEKSLASQTKDYIFGQGGASKIIAEHILKTIFPNSL